MKRLLIVGLLLSGCIGPYYWRNQLIANCRLLNDRAVRDRCIDDAARGTELEAIAVLNDLYRLSPEKCVAITQVREQMLEYRFAWYYEWAWDQTANYFRRTLPKEGPDAWSEWEIMGAVNWAYQGRGIGNSCGSGSGRRLGLSCEVGA